MYNNRCLESREGIHFALDKMSLKSNNKFYGNQNEEKKGGEECWEGKEGSGKNRG
jgi:hypothetical protein